MNLSPVILRELRSEARHPLNHWLRLAGAAAAIVVLAIIAGGDLSDTGKLGARLFIRFHAITLVGIWLIAPLATADCLSRERRDGTLGLLFLTPLRAIEIVTGKMFVHAWRMAGFWLAVAPVMAIPLLLGGVTRLDLCTAFALELTALMLAVSAGVLASAYATKRSHSLLLAEIFAVLLAAGSGLFVSLILEVQAGYVDTSLWEETGLRDIFDGVLALETGWDQGDYLWSYLFSLVPAAYRLSWHWTVVETVVMAALVSYALAHRAAGRTQRSVREDSPSKLRLWLKKAFLSPRFGRRYFGSWLKSRLDRNPIGWLHARSTPARAAKWGWCAVMIIGVCTGRFDVEVLKLLSAIVIAGLAFSAVLSFRRERDAGMLELVLVSPLEPGKIILGGAAALLGQVLPAAVVLVVTLFLGSGANEDPLYALLLFGSTCVLVAFLGMYLSMRMPGTLPPWLICCAAALGPLILARIILHVLISLLEHLGVVRAEESAFQLWRMMLLGLQCSLAVYAYRRLLALLNERTYSS
jgi:ABC-type transport system involved in cytochrome c biogenesis permease component